MKIIVKGPSAYQRMVEVSPTMERVEWDGVYIGKDGGVDHRDYGFCKRRDHDGNFNIGSTNLETIRKRRQALGNLTLAALKMNNHQMLSPLSFDDLFKVPQSGGTSGLDSESSSTSSIQFLVYHPNMPLITGCAHVIAGMAFSLVPPTPQDLVLVRPFTSPIPRTSTIQNPRFTFPPSLTSPPPIDSGIMAPFAHLQSQSQIQPPPQTQYQPDHSLNPNLNFATHSPMQQKLNLQPTAAASRSPSRSPSLTSLGSHRHSPYNNNPASRRSSTTSHPGSGSREPSPVPALSGINPTYLTSINPAALRPNNRLVSVSDTSEAGSTGSWQSMGLGMGMSSGQGEEVEDTENSSEEEQSEDGEEEVSPASDTGAGSARHPGSEIKVETRGLRAPSGRSTAGKRRESPVEEVSSKPPVKKRVQKILVAEPTSVRLVTAITASGKKSHARKVSQAKLLVTSLDGKADGGVPGRDRKIIYPDLETLSYCSGNMWWTRN